MAVLELLVVAVSLPAILLAMADQAARALARQPEPLAVQAACPALRVLPLLRVAVRREPLLLLRVRVVRIVLLLRRILGAAALGARRDQRCEEQRGGGEGASPAQVRGGSALRCGACHGCVG